MSVSSILYAGLATAAAPVRTSESTGFVVAPSAAATPAAGPSPAGVGRTASVSAAMILALQEHATAETGDREARQHGRQLLDALADLQRALLSNGGGDALQRLAALADLPLPVADPVLARVIVAIRLRARVEAARAEAASARGTAGPS
ncbi:MAG: flagellar assembly protein FliX [Janthinobacterium lividum]